MSASNPSPDRSSTSGKKPRVLPVAAIAASIIVVIFVAGVGISRYLPTPYEGITAAITYPYRKAANGRLVSTATDDQVPACTSNDVQAVIEYPTQAMGTAGAQIRVQNISPLTACSVKAVAPTVSMVRANVDLNFKTNLIEAGDSVSNLMAAEGSTITLKRESQSPPMSRGRQVSRSTHLLHRACRFRSQVLTISRSMPGRMPKVLRS